MSSPVWTAVATAAGEEDTPWSLFQESAKGSPFEGFLPDSLTAAWMAQSPESLAFEPYPSVELPEPAPLALPLGEAIAARRTPPRLEAAALSLAELASLLHHAYGVTGEDPHRPRRRRAVASQSSLYPLEIFFHTIHVDGLRPGLYHFQPALRALRFLRANDQTAKIAPGLQDKSLALHASVLLFLVAVPERMVIRYGDRGYRFVLLEAGAVAQNLDLAAGALGLACLPVAESFERRIDEWLGLDGVTMSTVHIAGIGKERSET